MAEDQRRFLVVDDELSAATLLRSILLQAWQGHCTVDIETAVDSAVNRIEQSAPYDVILMDHGMPGNGSNGIGRIRNVYASTPIIVVTGFPDEAAVFGNDPEVADVINKDHALSPFSPDKPHRLVGSVKRCLGRAATVEQMNKAVLERIDRLDARHVKTHDEITKLSGQITALEVRLTQCQLGKCRTLTKAWKPISAGIAAVLTAIAGLVAGRMTAPSQPQMPQVPAAHAQQGK